MKGKTKMKNYELRVVPKKDCDGNIYWTAFYPVVDGCVGGGNTPEEAIAEAKENLEFYLEYLEDLHKPAPKEYEETAYNGKIALRVAKSTHQKMVQVAEEEGISLNSLINAAVENYLGKKEYEYKTREAIAEIRELAQKSILVNCVNSAALQEMSKGRYPQKISLKC